MAYFLRAPSTVDFRRSHPLCSSRRENDQLVFIHSATLAAHDRCSHAAGVGPDFKSRKEFDTIAGAGWDWCWAPTYTTIGDPKAPPCYWCRKPVAGSG